MEQLTKRARNVLKFLDIGSPADLTLQSQMIGLSPFVYLMRAPFCGRKTAAEILAWYEASAPDLMPSRVWVRIRRDAHLQWRVMGASFDRRDGEDWYWADIATPEGET